MDPGEVSSVPEKVVVQTLDADPMAEEQAVTVDLVPGANIETSVETSNSIVEDAKEQIVEDSDSSTFPTGVSKLSTLWNQWTQSINNNMNNDNGSVSGGSQLLQQPVMIQGITYTDVASYEERINSIVNLTYRFDFEPIPKHADGPTPVGFIPNMIFTKGLYHNFTRNVANLMSTEAFTNDVGWGCMIRTSQSLLANSLVLFARDSVNEEAILDYFRDTSDAPFSLHNFIQVAGESPLQVKPGEWFGPNAASLSIKRLTGSLKDWTPLPKIEVMISEASDLYDDRVRAVFAKPGVSGLLVLFPVRLGIDKINAVYHSSLLHLLSIPNSVGIAGGKPSSSFYFVGYQGSELIYLDPHYPQSANDEDIKLLNKTYHPRNYQRLDITGLDPSMMIGINLKDWEDYTRFKKSCADNSNKIIYFLEYSPSLTAPIPTLPRERKNSEFVLITSDDYEEDFVTIDNDQSEFVDIKDEVKATDNEDMGSEVLVSDPVEESVMVEEG